jgi:hypothetical protein
MEKWWIPVGENITRDDTNCGIVKIGWLIEWDSCCVIAGDIFFSWCARSSHFKDQYHAVETIPLHQEKQKLKDVIWEPVKPATLVNSNGQQKYMNIYMYYLLQLTESYWWIFWSLSVVRVSRQKRSVQKHKLGCRFFFSSMVSVYSWKYYHVFAIEQYM